MYTHKSTYCKHPSNQSCLHKMLENANYFTVIRNQWLPEVAVRNGAEWGLMNMFILSMMIISWVYKYVKIYHCALYICSVYCMLIIPQ